MDRDLSHPHPHNHHHHQQQLPKQENLSSQLSPNTDSPRNKTIPGAGNSNNNAGIANDRLKRDEWSEGAVSSLLEAYESKWVLRNRAKLKGQDWEDVAKHVSSRANNTKSAKTQTQCKNKIESMKKRYRSESAAAETSSWPLYPRLDHLLRGNGPQANSVAAAAPPPLSSAATLPPPVVPVEPSPPPPPPLSVVAPPVLQPGSVAQNSHASDGFDCMPKRDVNNNNNIGAKSPEKNLIGDSDSSTPAIYTEKAAKTSRKNKVAMKRKRNEYWEIGESIRWLAEVMVRSEQARLETMREIERMRAESEAKRGEMELKRTEIIANTQLEIAKLFAKGSSSNVDSSLRIGRS